MKSEEEQLYFVCIQEFFNSMHYALYSQKTKFLILAKTGGLCKVPSTKRKFSKINGQRKPLIFKMLTKRISWF